MGAARGRSHAGKMLIIGAIELGDGTLPGRLRLAEISSYGATDLSHFVETVAGEAPMARAHCHVGAGGPVESCGIPLNLA